MRGRTLGRLGLVGLCAGVLACSSDDIEPPPAALDYPIGSVTDPAASSFAPFETAMATDWAPAAQTYTLPVWTGQIDNLDRDVVGAVVPEISYETRQLLQNNGFVALPLTAAQQDVRERFQDAYGWLAENEVPVFVTADSVLHLYHLVFDQLLKVVEVERLSRDLDDLLAALVEACRAQHATALRAGETRLAEAARRNLAYFSVAARLLEPSFVVDPLVTADVEAEIALIDAHRGLATSPLMSLDCPSSCDPCDAASGGGLACAAAGEPCLCEDYSQYVARGHYTISPALERYFRAMMWLGRIGLRLHVETETLQAVLATAALKQAELPGGVPAAVVWHRLYKVTAFFAGAPDDLTFADYDQAITEVLGDGVALAAFADPATLSTLRARLEELRKPRILGGFAYQLLNETEATMGWRFLGQRFAPDSYALGQLVFDHVHPDLTTAEHRALAAQVTGNPDPTCDDLTEQQVNDICYAAIDTGPYGACRLLPRGLDVMAALGSSEAIELLRGDGRYCRFDEQRQAMADEFAGYDPAAMTQNAYWAWLFALQPLLESFGDGYPAWMQTAAWRTRSLNTALASWAQLRHDTVLYVKQSYTPAAAGSLPPPEAFGYVEPVPRAYDRLAGLARLTRQGLATLDALPPALSEPLDRLAELLDRLRAIAQKELAQEALSPAEINAIKGMGDTFEALIADLAAAVTVPAGPCPPEDRACEPTNDLSDPDFDRTSVVVDVHTDVNTQQVLEVGSGALDWIVVAHRLPGEDEVIGAAVGPIFSYYELPHPLADRLTDAAWRDLLATEPPARPEWVQLYRAPDAARSR